MAGAPSPPCQLDDVGKLFNNMDILLGISQQFLMLMESRAATTAFSRIGDIFLKVQGVFLIYSKYYRNYDSAVQRLEALSQHEEFRSKIVVSIRH